MARTAGPELIEVVCAKCKKFLAAVPLGADLRCPKCGKWTTARKVKQ